ncbi:MAG TPA: septation protein IspZ [Rhizomicrobium sp.]|nr:septation protein IspZ [Rhizomicrobium sp.]
MKDLLHAAKFLVFDLASTLFFFALYGATHNIALSVIAGLALAFGQVGWELARKRRVDALQWVSLVAVAASGLSTLHSGNPLYVMLQPSALYALAGLAMLQRGWMNRYLPPRALQYLPDLGIAFGYVWAGLMFVSAAVNIGLALSLEMKAWGAAIAIWGLASKATLLLIQFGVMKSVGHRRHDRRAALA